MTLYFELGPMSSFDSSSLTAVREAGTIVLKSVDGDTVCAVPVSVLPSLIEYLQSVLNTDRRRAYRVPVTHEDLDVTLTWNGLDIPVTPVDLSCISVGLRSTGAPPDAAIDDDVTVSLRHGSHHVVVDGLVKRNSNGAIGIEFPSFLTVNEPTPTEPMRALVAAVKVCYIKRRNEDR